MVLNNLTISGTVETRLTATSVIWSPHYYNHFFWPGKTVIHFLVKKNVYSITHKYSQVGHVFKSQTVESFTQLMKPLV